MKSFLITLTGVFLTLVILWAPTPIATAYSYKPRELRVRTTAYTHTESDHVSYGRKTALGTRLRFSREYTSAAADWSKFPVGTEFRIKGLNRNFVIDDYGSALVGKDTIDLYFTSKRDMNRWGARHVDIVITKYGDFEKSREILAGRKKYRHCRAMLAGIEANAKKSEGMEEQYEVVPEWTDENDHELMAAASIPKSEWDVPAPELFPDPKQPENLPQVEIVSVDLPWESETPRAPRVPEPDFPEEPDLGGESSPSPETVSLPEPAVIAATGDAWFGETDQPEEIDLPGPLPLPGRSPVKPPAPVKDSSPRVEVATASNTTGSILRERESGPERIQRRLRVFREFFASNVLHKRENPWERESVDGVVKVALTERIRYREVQPLGTGGSRSAIEPASWRGPDDRGRRPRVFRPVEATNF